MRRARFADFVAATLFFPGIDREKRRAYSNHYGYLDVRNYSNFSYRYDNAIHQATNIRKIETIEIILRDIIIYTHNRNSGKRSRMYLLQCHATDLVGIKLVFGLNRDKRLRAVYKDKASGQF